LLYWLDGTLQGTVRDLTEENEPLPLCPAEIRLFPDDRSEPRIDPVGQLDMCPLVAAVHATFYDPLLDVLVCRNHHPAAMAVLARTVHISTDYSLDGEAIHVLPT
jgi:hypothetical protein